LRFSAFVASNSMARLDLVAFVSSTRILSSHGARPEKASRLSLRRRDVWSNRTLSVDFLAAVAQSLLEAAKESHRKSGRQQDPEAGKSAEADGKKLPTGRQTHPPGADVSVDGSAPGEPIGEGLESLRRATGRGCFGAGYFQITPSFLSGAGGALAGRSTSLIAPKLVCF
jgi:hypothetical protein